MTLKNQETNSNIINMYKLIVNGVTQGVHPSKAFLVAVSNGDGNVVRIKNKKHESNIHGRNNKSFKPSGKKRFNGRKKSHAVAIRPSRG